MKNNIISVELIGPSEKNYGLCNQLFQIASAVSYAKDHQFLATFPCLKEARLGGYINNFLRNVNTEDCPVPPMYYKEPEFHYSQIPAIPGSFCIRESYLQSEKYFSHNRDTILELYDPSKEDISYLTEKYDLTIPTTSLHVRRQDYLDYSEYHTNIMETDYYDKALDALKPESVLVFSDDPGWARKAFPTCTVAEEKDYLELYLMSLCDNNIIANSSFSWWGAWLNKNPEKKVVAPKNWFGDKHPYSTKDLIPSDWIVL
tara:strand:- start:7462 stop:8238 length:777 start_codon:yes stop_codon:yes gene_type:complete